MDIRGYAGVFDCKGPCGRMRITAASFSKRQLELYRSGELMKVTKGVVACCSWGPA